MQLNGYTLKAVKTMETMDGIAYSCNIYFGGKKIGMACNDGRGGMTDIHVMPGIPDRAALCAVLTEDFAERLFTLHGYEKAFKAHPAGKSMAFVSYSGPFDLEAYLCGQNITAEALTAHIGKTKTGREIDSIEIFRSLDDFNIDESQQQEMADNQQPGEGTEEGFGGMTMTM